eukprot:15327581-Ditylum_brightwellii.AAC.1
MVMKDINFILPATMVLYQKYRENIITKQANVMMAVFLKNMQTRSTTMLTAETLVEEKNVSAPILGEIIQDKVTHSLQVQKRKIDLEKRQEKKKRKKQNLWFEDEQENLDKDKEDTREEEEEEELQ